MAWQLLFFYMRRSQSILISTVLITSLLSFSLGWFFAKNIETEGAGEIPLSASAGNAQNIANPNLNEVWAKLNNDYYDASKLNAEKLKYGAVKGLVASIGDPYTVFMTPDEYKEFDSGLEGELEGIGAQLGVKEGKLIVIAPLKDSPAEKAGVKRGDIIYKIDGEMAGDMTLADAIRKIRGRQGTKVTLSVIRDVNKAPVEFTITRGQIVLETVTLEKKDGDIFYLSINQFNDHTQTEFRNAAQKILLEKAKGLVLDLRDNGGGYVDSSISVLSELIAGEKTAVIERQRNEKNNQVMKTAGNATLGDIPLVVLVNKGSASASEIVAGAIQDYKRGLLMGERTFGKGSMQELDKLNDGSNLRLTIAKWFTPLNRSIDGVGIMPDKEVKISDEDEKAGRDPQLDEALKYLRALK